MVRSRTPGGRGSGRAAFPDRLGRSLPRGDLSRPFPMSPGASSASGRARGKAEDAVGVPEHGVEGLLAVDPAVAVGGMGAVMIEDRGGVLVVDVLPELDDLDPIVVADLQLGAVKVAAVVHLGRPRDQVI